MKVNIILISIFLIVALITLYLRKKKSSIEEIKYTINTLNNNTMELNSDYIITRISWTKNNNDKINYLLGIFEGANDPSFSDAVPIAMIKEQEVFNQINYIDVNIPKVYKYIRYIPPLKMQTQTDVNPIKFYGKLQSNKDINSKKDFQVTNLPLISIYTQDSITPVSKDEKIDCNITITNEGNIELRENATIKVRGKSTSFPPKKPYSIKFNTKQKVLGLKGSYKKWVLLANYFDITSIRNALAFKISELIGFEFTPRCISVDLILNGQYRGNYYLCDHVEIGKQRINIDELKKTDITEPSITGGYFFEIDGAGEDHGYINLVTKKGIKWRIKEPEEDDITEEQNNYIIEKMNQFESDAYNGNFTNLDLETFSKFLLVDEFSGDPDEIWSNFYITKKRNDDKFYFGPVWDFDLCFDNDNRLFPINDKSKFIFYYGESAGTMFNFTEMLIKNKTIIEYIQKTWENLKKTALNENVLIDFIEQEYNHIKESSKLNILVWNDYTKGRMSNFIHFGEKVNYENIVADLNALKEYIKKRFVSLTNLINQAVSEAK